MPFLDGIVDGFRDAVLQFCEHPKLQYFWMRFLPKFSFDPFWGTILFKINKALESTAILRPQNHGPLRLISQLRVIPNDFELDDNSPEPLLADSSNELFLAPGYTEQDVSALQTLGLRGLTVQDVVDLVKRDLNASPSRIRSADRTDEWHSRLTKFLLTSVEGGCIPYLKTMTLIPLHDGQWASASLSSVYFPEDHGTPIPTDLGLQLVDPKSVRGAAPWRKKLFITLCVKYVSSSLVRNLIVAQYDKPNPPPNMSLQHSVEHLCHLSFTYEYGPVTPSQNITTQDTFRSTGSGRLPFGANPLSVSSSPSINSDCEGTAGPRSEPYIQNQYPSSVLVKPEDETKDRFQSICCLAKYKPFSPEEIRLADYAGGYRQCQDLSGSYIRG